MCQGQEGREKTRRRQAEEAQIQRTTDSSVQLFSYWKTNTYCSYRESRDPSHFNYNTCMFVFFYLNGKCINCHLALSARSSDVKLMLNLGNKTGF